MPPPHLPPLSSRFGRTDMSVPGLERGVAILRLFRRDRRYLSAPQIADELHIPRSTVHRLIATLADLGLVRRVDASRFALAAGVLTLGYECLASLDVVGIADPLLATLRDETGWSTHLAVRQARSVVYLARHASRAAVTTNIAVGTSLPAHATMMGRMLLSALDPEELRSLYAGVELATHGPETPRTLAALEALIEADRHRGFAVSKGFYQHGIAAVAAPLRDGSRKVIASINATAPAEQEAANLDAVTSAVVRAAEAISVQLGAPAANASLYAAPYPLGEVACL
jgi:DNA-binding IclR family transcriptional regulator